MPLTLLPAPHPRTQKAIYTSVQVPAYSLSLPHFLEM